VNKPKKDKGDTLDVVCRNRKASQRYEFEDRFEAGMVLTGSEVKSLRDHRADLDGAYASTSGLEVYLHQMHIAEYKQAGAYGHELKRPRKLLLHRAQIEKIRGRLTSKGYTLIPLSVYFKKSYAKVELALAKGKREGDKRHEIRRDIDLREAREAIARRH